MDDLTTPDAQTAAHAFAARLARWHRWPDLQTIKPTLDWVILGWLDDQLPRPERMIQAKAILEAAGLLGQVDLAYLYDRKGFEPDQLIAARKARPVSL